MLRKIFWICVFVVANISVQAQEAGYQIPDYQSIAKSVSDKHSLFYYPPLFKRYQEHDTTLTLREYRMLYYGYLFQEHFSPFGNLHVNDSLRQLLSNTSLKEDQWRQVIALEERHLQQSPFDLRDLNTIKFAYRQIGDSQMARLYLFKIRMIARTILSSGDGQGETSAFHVISIPHEYDMIHILGYEFGGEQQLTANQCDFLSLKENDDQMTGLYFDVKQLFRAYPQLSQQE
jgi:hypothetical protein